MFNLIANRFGSDEVNTTVSVPATSLKLALCLTLDDDLSRQWYFFGYSQYEAPVVTVLTSLVQALPANEQCVICDVGANIGYYTLLLASLASKHENAVVHAFEPSPKVYRLLDRNVELNPKLRIVLNPNAVCAVAGSATLHLAHERFGNIGASLVAGSIAQVGSVEVETVSLDGYLARLPDAKVSLLKMDCEGVEARVLAGMEKTLERDSPHIVLEVLPRYPSLPADLAALPFFRRYLKYNITDAGLVQHDELRPSYQHRDWLLSVKPPEPLILRSI